MITVPAAEFSKNFGRYREVVLQPEQVAVTSHERVTGYFVSSVEYDEYLRLKSLMPKTYAIEELPHGAIDEFSEATVQAVGGPKLDPGRARFNLLLDE